MNKNTRKATHAGSWYSSDSKKLDSELSKWLSEAIIEISPKSIKAIIAP